MTQSTLHSHLSLRHTPHMPLALRQRLSLKEQRTVYCAEFGERRESVVYHVDGDIITEGYKCDFLILADRKDNKRSWLGVFVELKGTDVEHALQQLEATLRHPELNHPSVSGRHARIVARSFPSSKANPRFEAAKRRFKMTLKTSLKQVKSGDTDRLE